MVTLRCFAEPDIPLLLDYLNNPKVTWYLTSHIPQPYTLNDAEWWIREGSTQGMVRAIESEGTLVGCVGATPEQFEYSRNAEIGYWLAKPFWGKGIATHALAQMTAEVFSTTQIARLYAYVFEGNAASQRVLEKCGYRQEALLEKAVFKRGAFSNAWLYAAIAPDKG